MIPKIQPRGRIDKSALAFPIAPRIRSKAHLDWIRKQRCCVPGCARRDVEAHHLLQCEDAKARGLKASDAWTVPLCHTHHMALHLYGFEQEWAQGLGVDLIATAAELWRRSPGNKEHRR